MKSLIFGTTYIDGEYSRDVAEKWWKLHGAINPECDLLFVDSASPLPISHPMIALQLGDNIGHLSRSGQDGWGRAFCAGLQYAVDNEYEYVAHIEGDSLCRIDVLKTFQSMQRDELVAVSVPVRGLKKPEYCWVETGLMFLDVTYVRDSKLVDRYDWRDGKSKGYPNTPEHVLHGLIGTDLKYGNWRTIRDDRNYVNAPQNYDWITHATRETLDAFYEHNMPKVPA